MSGSETDPLALTLIHTSLQIGPISAPPCNLYGMMMRLSFFLLRVCENGDDVLMTAMTVMALSACQSTLTDGDGPWAKMWSPGLVNFSLLLLNASA